MCKNFAIVITLKVPKHKTNMAHDLPSSIDKKKVPKTLGELSVELGTDPNINCGDIFDVIYNVHIYALGSVSYLDRGIDVLLKTFHE